MSGHILLLENTSYHSLDSAVRFQIDSACRLVLGARLRTVLSVEAVLAAHSTKGPEESTKNEVLLIPLLLPEREHECHEILRSLKDAVPLSSALGFGFLLFGRQGFSPESLLDPFWPEFLDSLYEFGVPSFVGVWHGGLASVEVFQLSSSLSSLFRELDSLAELKQFGRTLSDLESRIAQLQT